MSEKMYTTLHDSEGVRAVINQISLFGGLASDHLDTLFRLLREVSYVKDEYVFSQGDEPTHIYIVRSGEIRLVADIDGELPVEIARFSHGQCFGETAVIGIQPHSATAVATCDTDLIVLTGDALLSLFHENVALFSLLILNIAREACRRLHRTDETFLHYVGKNHISL